MPEEAIDRITRLAAQIIGVPIALVSLIDDDRQWFKSRVGLDAAETPRDMAFCSHAIMQDEVMIVHDASDDPRFAANPLVTGPPDIRFYAGAPLILRDNVRLGTLCAIDTKPRLLDSDEVTALRDLAAVVVDEFQLRKSLKIQAETSETLRLQATELRLANDALDQFAHLAAHDLRAPLKQVINLLDIALLKPRDNSEDVLQMARRSAVNLETMVAGYRTLTRLERGCQKERLVSTLVEEAHALGGGGGRSDVESDAALLCDPMLMTQVFVNLIDNAQAHGSCGDLTIAATSNDRSTRIRATNPVAETFPVDRTIFAPFRRLSADDGGTGLGLAIVDRIARIHGGTVSATCDDSLFTVEIDIPHHEPT